MPTKLAKGGVALDGSDPASVEVLQSQDAARRVAVAAVASDMTDNGGGTDNSKVTYSAPVASVAVSGSNLADKTTTEAAAVKVKDALSEVYAKLNAYCTALNIPTLTDNSGGAAADGTIGAMDASVTGATTGVVVANTNTYIAAVNSGLQAAVAKANAIAAVLGLSKLKDETKVKGEFPKIITTIPALSTSLGTAAAPGVSKAAMDAVLVEQRNSIKSLAVFIATFNTSRAPQVIGA